MADLLRVQSLHALKYCERLFYLEEVEEIRVADAAVFAGRRLHIELDEGERLSLELASFGIGLTGKVDAVRRKDGVIVVTEQKRGRPAKGANGVEAWESDRIQVAAYGLLVEEKFPGEPVECRIRYHQPAANVVVPLDSNIREQVRFAIERARVLRAASVRPPVTEHEQRCIRCSLAPVCLPVEEREHQNVDALRLFPEDDVRQVVHVATPGARVGRSQDEFKVSIDEETEVKIGAKTVAAVALHGAVQISAQALQMCVNESIAVHWFTTSGNYVGGLGGRAGSVHRRIRQFEALRDAAFRFSLARRLVSAKVEGQLRFALRASRENKSVRSEIGAQVRDMRSVLKNVHHAESAAGLLGLEGAAAAAYFHCFARFVSSSVPESMHWNGRSRRPPTDRFNALLSFFYGLVHREVEAALLSVGLDTAFGFYHQPRGSAGPLALDVMELFRVPLADMPVLASINRGTWDADEDFDVSTKSGVTTKVWLSGKGRKKALEVFERRRRETWKHNVLGYSVSYARLVELEVRLLEKEWTGKPGLFATFRLR